MNKGDAFPLSTDSRNVIDQPKTRLTTFFHGRLEIIDREADVMNSRAAASYEFPDRSVVSRRFEELDKRFSRGDGGDVCSVGIVDLRRLQPEDVSEEWHARRDGLDRNSNVGDTGALGGFLLH